MSTFLRHSELRPGSPKSTNIFFPCLVNTVRTTETAHIHLYQALINILYWKGHFLLTGSSTLKLSLNFIYHVLIFNRLLIQLFPCLQKFLYGTTLVLQNIITFQMCGGGHLIFLVTDTGSLGRDTLTLFRSLWLNSAYPIIILSPTQTCSCYTICKLLKWNIFC